MPSFNDLNLPLPLQKALADLNFESPTQVQADALPHALQKRDLLVSSQTGSGKTIAFLIPMLVRMIENPDINSLVLVPTRELALQVQTVLISLTNHMRQIKSVVLVGGMSMRGQLYVLKNKPRVIIATPGRLMDHMGQRTVNLKNVSFCVVDEADRMFEMGFIEPLRKIMAQLNPERQTLLFSATFPPAIKRLAEESLKNPFEIKVQKEIAPPTEIVQEVKEVQHSNKNDEVLNVVNAAHGLMLIFTRTQVRADRLADYLDSYGVRVGLIHGGRSQGQRNRSLNDFRTGASHVLVATDVASRGIDVPSVAHVVNYDLPQTPEDYIHRIGRTGRAGQKGHALSFVTPEDFKLWAWISKKTGAQKLDSKPWNRGQTKSDRPERSERPRRTESFDRSARPERSERSERPERSGGFSRERFKDRTEDRPYRKSASSRRDSFDSYEQRPPRGAKKFSSSIFSKDEREVDQPKRRERTASPRARRSERSETGGVGGFHSPKRSSRPPSGGRRSERSRSQSYR